MIAYSFGLSLAPTLVGFLLALGFVRYVLKTKLIRQLKIISYVSSLIFSTIILAEFFPLTDSANVVVGTLFGFIFPIAIALIIKKSKKSENSNEL
jgi:sulfite exporter TauE/SafE